jgi:hypothetical protein
MEQYRTDPTRTKELRSALLRRMVPMLVLVAVMVTVLMLYLQNREEAGENAPMVTLFIIPFFGVLGIYSVRKVLTQQINMYLSFTVTLEHDRVTRHIDGWPTLTIPHASLKRIEEQPDGTLVLHGEGPQNVIGISKYMVDRDTLRERLAQLHPISTVPAKAHSQLWSLGSGILVFVLIAATYVSENKLVVMVCGSLGLLFMLGSFGVIQWSKHVDLKSKRSSWLILLVVPSLVYLMYHKLIVLP